MHDTQEPDLILQSLRLARVNISQSSDNVGSASRLVRCEGWEDLVSRNKVAALAQANIRKLARGCKPAHPLAIAADRLAVEPPTVPAAAITAIRARTEPWRTRTGCPVLGIKGLATRWWYPEPELRTMNDVDLWLPDLESAASLADHLHAHGWTRPEEDPPMTCASDSGRRSGVICLSPLSAEVPSVDIQFGDIAAGPQASVLIDPHRTCVTPDGWQRTSDADTLLCLVAGVSNQGWVTGKDVNDAYLLARHGAPEWPAAVHQLRGPPLADAAAALAAAVQRVYGNEPATALLTAHLGATRSPAYPLGELANAEAASP